MALWEDINTVYIVSFSVHCHYSNCIHWSAIAFCCTFKTMNKAMKPYIRHARHAFVSTLSSHGNVMFNCTIYIYYMHGKYLCVLRTLQFHIMHTQVCTCVYSILGGTLLWVSLKSLILIPLLNWNLCPYMLCIHICVYVCIHKNIIDFFTGCVGCIICTEQVQVDVLLVTKCWDVQGHVYQTRVWHTKANDHNNGGAVQPAQPYRLQGECSCYK